MSELRMSYIGLRAGISYPIEVVGSYLRESTESRRNRLKVLSCGGMLAGAAASPSFYPSALGWRGIYTFAISLYIISTITYACFYWKEIAKNGHYTVAGISIIGILAIFYSPLSLDSFFPYVPVCVTVALLVTGYVVPRIREFFGPDDESTRSDEMTAMYTREASLDLESLTPLGDIRDLPWDPLAVSYMGDHSHTDHSIPGIPSSAGSVSSGEDDNNSSIESANTESRFSS